MATSQSTSTLPSAGDSEIGSRRSVGAPSQPWRVHRGPVNQYATADDRFSFPPVPGYTGYVPRNREHFGKSYAVTTLAALQSFEALCSTKSRLPPKVDALTQAGAGAAHLKPAPAGVSSNPLWLNTTAKIPVPTGNDIAETVDVDVRIRRDETMANTPTGHTATVLQKKRRAAELQEQCARDHMFLPGFTGFIPRERGRFGEQYQKSATAAMAEFKGMYREHELEIHDMEAVARSGPEAAKVTVAPGAHLVLGGHDPEHRKIQEANHKVDRSPYLRPIPGLTTYHRQHAQHVGGVHAMGEGEDSDQVPKKDLSVTLPIPGYKGFLPLYQMCGERSFGQSAKECIREFKSMMHENESPAAHSRPGHGPAK
ncbi:hypothetical protein H9P43_005918 [Blastocladiella emersonii ATCC 22665]|nr:hypothetical protein H9P43_005918 [Blastocladiella emersonii ATCC 22665]